MEPSEGYGFGLAIDKLRRGLRVQRAGWNGKGMWLRFVPHIMLPHEPPRLPYLEMFTASGELVPWLASQADVLASDWRDAP